jgi:Right handed beta helix region
MPRDRSGSLAGKTAVRIDRCVFSLAVLTASAFQALSTATAPGNPSGRQWFVSAASGRDDLQCGTIASPCATLNDIDARALQPGDTVHVRGAFALSKDSCILETRSGTPGNPITFEADPKWGASIDGRGLCRYVWRERGAYVRVTGFRFTGAQQDPAPYSRSIVFYSDAPAGGVEFSRNTIHDLGWQTDAAVVMAPFANRRYTGAPCSVHDNVFHDIAVDKPSSQRLGGYAIYVACGPESAVFNNLIFRIGSTAIHSWHAASGVNIFNNTIFQARTGISIGTGDSGAVADAVYDVYNNVISNSYVAIALEDVAPGSISSTTTVANNLLFRNRVNWHFDDSGVERSPEIAVKVFGNIVADPKFRSIVKDDFRVGRNSPAVDAVRDALVPDHDLDGHARPYGRAYDIGAYEWHP